MVFGVGTLAIAVALGMSTTAHLTNAALPLKQIVNQLPMGAMLRDAEPIPGTGKALILYILDPEIAAEDPLESYALTCPGEVNGQPIEGVYHLALVEDGAIVNDVEIPGDSLAEHRPQRLRLVYRQLESILDGQRGAAMDRVENGTARLVEAKLLKLRDLNGDGLPHEFTLSYQLGACGHVRVLIAGYSVRQGRAIVYPILGDRHSPYYWHDNFFPDKTGTIQWHLSCGDHGSPYGERKMFTFSEKRQAYVLRTRSQYECDL